MSQPQYNDNLKYLGKEFQNKFIWQLLVDQKFGEDVVDKIEASYLDDNFLKRIVVLYKNYFNEYGKVPSILNNSIVDIINEKISDNIEKETILTFLKKIKLYNKRVYQNKIPNDGDVVQKQIWKFIKQQKYIKLAKKIILNTAEGNTDQIGEIENEILAISRIGTSVNLGIDILHNIEDVLSEDYRSPIPTLIKGLDQAMGGGLGAGEMGFILAPLGTGKTTILTKIANSGFISGANVIQFFFEDTEKQIQRKHYCCFSEYGLNDYKDNKDDILKIVNEKVTSIKGKYNNRLDLVKLTQDDDVTIPLIKKIIKDKEKIFGVKYNLVVIDYIDCVESHLPDKKDILANELVPVKSFEAMLSDMNMAGWSAFQGNRTSIGSDVVNTNQLGGNIKKAQKTHFLMSIAKSDTQKQQRLANVKILKSRFGNDSLLFEDSLFDNEYLKIELNTSNITLLENVLNDLDSTENLPIENQGGMTFAEALLNEL